MNSKLLVIMPVYNTELYVDQAINSVLQQENVNLDLCLIDDCSTDNSFNIINTYKFNNNVIILKNKVNRGTYYCRNKALKLLHTNQYQYFTTHDSDDVSSINRYYHMIKMFDDDVSCVSSVYSRIYSKYINHSMIDIQKGRVQTDPGNGIGMYNIDVFNNIGYYDNNRFGADTDYFNRCNAWSSLNNKKIKKLKHVLYYARSRDDNLNTIHSNRSEYARKIKIDLMTMMYNKNFWRNSFN